MVLHIANHRVETVATPFCEVPASVLLQILTQARPSLRQQRLQPCKNPFVFHTFFHKDTKNLPTIAFRSSHFVRKNWNIFFFHYLCRKISSGSNIVTSNIVTGTLWGGFLILRATIQSGSGLVLVIREARRLTFYFIPPSRWELEAFWMALRRLHDGIQKAW